MLLDDVAFVAAPDSTEARRTLVQSGDVLLSITADLGRTGVVPAGIGRAFINQHLAILRVQNIHPPFLSAYLASPEGQIQVMGRNKHAVKAGLNFEDIRSFQIPLPPLPEQRRIAEVLDRAEALRAKRRAVLAQLDSLTRSLFLDLFGDDGENPKGWPVCAVAEYVSEFQGGKSIESESGENVVTQNRVLKVSAVTGMKYLPHESKPVPDSYEPPREHFAKPGDLLFSRANTTELVGAVAYVESTPLNVLLPDKLWRFVWRDPAAIEPLFVWALFQTAALRREIGRRATGTSGSMKNISQEKVFGIRTILPPIELQREFARRVTAVEKLKTAQRASLAELDALFAALQHRAFRGEL
jgi:type I restriction enzyme S subunit